MYVIVLFLLPLIVLSQLTCPSNQFDAGGSCQPCNIVCLKCSGSSSSSCTECVSTRIHDSLAGTCNCIDGYQQASTISADCQKITCHYSCQTCNNTANFCTTCPSNSFRSLVAGSGTCPCDLKYFDSGNPTCTACHYTCQQCTGSASNQCSSCNSANFRISDGSNGCKCMDKYFNSGSNQLCVACNYKCKTCSGSSTNCLTCGLNRGSTPGCACLAGFYDDGASQSCQTCQYSCKTCTNSSKCTSCDSVTAFRQLTSTSSYCVCLDRYFEVSVGTLICQSCHPTCFQCLGSNLNSACTACSSAANRQLAGSVCECKVGFFETNSNVQLCAPCHYSCRTCSVASTNCTSCSSALFRTLVGEACPCIDGYYQSAQTGLCVRCHTSCQTCTNGTQCATCDTTVKLYSLDANKLCSCEDTKYFNTTQNKCIACSTSCKTCSQTSPTYCLSCDSGRSLTTNTCPCLPYHYQNAAVCSPCHYSCQTCNGPLITDCLTCSTANNRDPISGGKCNCKTSYYDDGTKALCLQCSYECLTCTDASTCASCDSSKFRSDPSTKCKCISGYFENSTFQCQKCAYHCLTCSDSLTCLTCNSPNRQLNPTTLKCECPIRFYDNNVSLTCLACLPECKTCTNSSACTSCEISQFRSLSGTKRCPCIAKYYSLLGVCTPCLYHCKTCTTGTRCTDCNSTANRVLDSATKKCVCKVGYFDTGVQECQKCSYACTECVDTANKCTKCNTVQRSLVSTWCECPVKFYDNNVTVICPSCQYTCASCTNSSHCSTCNAAKFRTFDALNVRCSCIDKYYDDGSNELCKACSYKCKTCTNSTKCLTCDADKFRITPASLCPCMPKYYDSGTNSQICLPCHYSCSTCTDGLTCSTCQSSTYHRTLDSSTNLCKCQDKFYDDGSNQLCLPCVYSCATCQSSSSNCLTCADSTSHRQLVGNSCPCQKRFFDGNLAQICLSCHYTCETCSDTISCDTCDATKHREINQADDLCICMVGYFDDQLDHQTCQQCHLSCVSCEDDLACLTCDAGKKRLLNNTAAYDGSVSNFCICQYGFYSPGDSLACLPCHYSCQVCQGPNRDDCLFCDSSANRALSSSKKCLCQDGFYDDGTNQLCLPCHNYCTKCIGPNVNQCSSCESTKFYMSNETKCYVDCPGFSFNNIDGMICSSCSSNCLYCLNQNQCTQCQTSYHLLEKDTKCYAICPDGFWQKTAQKICQACPQGCKTCESNLNCLTCVDHYYLDLSATLCFSCYSNCKSCFGPAQDQCTSCYQPLYFKSNKCHNLTCPYGQYVDSILGCKNCHQRFPNSLTCNKTQPFLCLSNYKVSNGQCKICNQVQGYHLTKTTNTCSEICGDGKLYDYQCDDGNQLDGDGCSKNCMIQKDWSCTSPNIGQSSICQLQGQLSMVLKSIVKHPGKNKVTLLFTLSLLYRMVDNFAVDISGFSGNQFKWQHLQNSQNLAEVSLSINYFKDIQGKNVSITYGTSQSRRLLLTENKLGLQKTRLLTVATIVFSTELEISAFPPANFYTDQEKQFFDSSQSTIYVLALTLLIVSLLTVPKRTHLHSFTFSYILPKSWLIFCLALQSQFDWVNYVFRDIKSLAMFGGFSMGNCCNQVSQFYNFQSDIISNSLFILIAFLVAWILLGISFLVNKHFIKSIGFWNLSKYFALTIHILLIFPLFYTSLNALYFYSLESITDAFNITLSIAVSIFCLFIVIFSWYLTFKTEYSSDEIVKKKIYPQNFSEKSIGEKKSHGKNQFSVVITQKKRISTVFQNDFFTLQHNQIQSMQDLQIKDQNRQVPKTAQKALKNQSQIESISIIEQKEDNNFLLWDYIWLYQPERKQSKYFMPFTLSIFYIQALIMVFLSRQDAFYFMIVELSIEAIYFGVFLMFRPFKSRFTNFRILIIFIMFMAMESLMVYYLKLSRGLQYFKIGEVLFIYLCGITYFLAIVFCVIEHLISWKTQLWNFIQPCLIYFFLKNEQKDKESNPQFKTTQNLISVTPQQKIQAEQVETPQIDVFYMRMIKKQKANKKYRKQRKMKESLYSPY